MRPNVNVSFVSLSKNYFNTSTTTNISDANTKDTLKPAINNLKTFLIFLF